MSEELHKAPVPSLPQGSGFRIAAAVGLFVLAVTVRLAVVLPLQEIHDAGVPPRYPIEDDREYHETTRSFVIEPDGRLPVWRPPGYILFCAPAYLIDSDFGYRWVWRVQAVIGSLSCVLLFLIVSRWSTFGVGFLAGLLYALQLEAVLYCAKLMRETLFVFLWLLLAWLGMRKPEEITYGRAGLIGAAAVPLVFTRPEGIVLVAVLFLWLILQKRSTAGSTIGKAAIVLLVLAPFVAWNGYRVQRVEGTFAPFGMDGPGLLYVGNNPDTGKWGYFHDDPRAKFPELEGKTHAEKNRFLLAKTLEYITENPTGFLKGLIYKSKVLLFGTYKYWQASSWTLGEDLVVTLKPPVGFPLIGYGFLLVAATFGAIRRPRSAGWGMIALWMLTYFLVMVMVASFARGRVSLLPFLAAWAAWGVSIWWAPIGRRCFDREGTWPALRNLLLGGMVLFAAWHSRWITNLFDFSPPPADVVWNELNGLDRSLEIQTDVGTVIEIFEDGRAVRKEIVDSWNGKKKLNLPVAMRSEGDAEVRLTDPAGNTTLLKVLGYDFIRLEGRAEVALTELADKTPGASQEVVAGKEVMVLEPGAALTFVVQPKRDGGLSVKIRAASQGAASTGLKAEVGQNLAGAFEVTSGPVAEYRLEGPIQAGTWLARLQVARNAPALVLDAITLELSP